MMTTPTLQNELKGLARDLRWRRRLRLLVRSMWLALLWLGVGLVVQMLHRQPPWLPLEVAAGVTLLAGLVWSFASNPKLPDLARTYDRHFDLQEQLASALETATHAPSSTIAERLVEQAMITIRQYRSMIRSLPRLPWREVETLVAVMLMIVALALVGGNNRLPVPQPLDLPSLAPPPSPDQPQPTDQPAAHDSPSAANNQAAANALAQALAGTGATRPAADALQRGDSAGAAQSLRDQAGQADQLGQAARNTLSKDLQSAADQLQQNQGQRAGDINRSAQELANNPQQGLQDLAQVVDGLGKGNAGAGAQAAATTGAGQGGGGAGGSLGGNGKRLGGEARTGPSNPPQAAGNTLPLPTSPAANGPATSATGPKGPTVQLQAGGTSSSGRASAGGGGSNDPLPGEADPLRIPPEDRDAVENYFSPAP